MADINYLYGYQSFVAVTPLIKSSDITHVDCITVFYQLIAAATINFRLKWVWQQNQGSYIKIACKA